MCPSVQPRILTFFWLKEILLCFICLDCQVSGKDWSCMSGLDHEEQRAISDFRNLDSNKTPSGCRWVPIQQSCSSVFQLLYPGQLYHIHTIHPLVRHVAPRFPRLFDIILSGFRRRAFLYNQIGCQQYLLLLDIQLRRPSQSCGTMIFSTQSVGRST